MAQILRYTAPDSCRDDISSVVRSDFLLSIIAGTYDLFQTSDILFLNPRCFWPEIEGYINEPVTADYSAQKKKNERTVPKALHFNTHWEFIIEILSLFLSLIYRFDASDPPH